MNRLDKLIELNMQLITALLEAKTGNEEYHSVDHEHYNEHYTIAADEDNVFHEILGKLEELTADPEFSGMDK